MHFQKAREYGDEPLELLEHDKVPTVVKVNVLALTPVRFEHGSPRLEVARGWAILLRYGRLVG